MSLIEQIQQELLRLPLEKQGEVLDFILFLQKRSVVGQRMKNSLSKNPAFGSWRGRNIDALKYQIYHRSQWDK
ncbi:MAG: DUF2281 domain-containing protein [Anaerolineales bacterium]